ncbi:MAG TPA: hypothetical protein VE111_16000 [Bradyrhizobium sp.]|nr:hypothetical protein [Bradyrhizobium sp.]
MFEVVLVLFGFGCGYGVREWISRRRRATAREEFLARLERKQLQPGSVSMIETISPDLSLTNDIPDQDRRRPPLAPSR